MMNKDNMIRMKWGLGDGKSEGKHFKHYLDALEGT